MAGSTLISPGLNEALDKQVANELAASTQYLMVAAYFDREGLPGLAGLFYRQAEEEHEHALKIIYYVTNAGGRLAIPEVPAQRSDFSTAHDAVELALNQEIEVTGLISSLVNLAIEEGDHLARSFLDWFVREQLEEVASMSQLLKTVERAGDNLLLVEDYLARRGLHPSSGPAEPQS